MHMSYFDVYVYILGVFPIAHELCLLVVYIRRKRLHMFYYLVYDCICWAWNLMDKDYCHGMMYWMYYYVVILNTYIEIIIVMKCAKD